MKLKNRKTFIPKFRINDQKTKQKQQNNPCINDNSKSKSFIRLSQYHQKSTKIVLDSLNLKNCFLVKEEIKKHLIRLMNNQIEIKAELQKEIEKPENTWIVLNTSNNILKRKEFMAKNKKCVGKENIIIRKVTQSPFQHNMERDQIKILKRTAETCKPYGKQKRYRTVKNTNLSREKDQNIIQAWEASPSLEISYINNP